MRRGFFGWLRDLFVGPRCLASIYMCHAWRDPRCGSGYCVEHCQTFCRGRCMAPRARGKLLLMEGGAK